MVSDLFPPLSGAAEQRLRDSIAAVGVIYAIKVDQYGEIIDGHNRARLAAELGVECPRDTVVVADDAERVRIVVEANWQRRELTKTQRDALVERLRCEYEWSDAMIAERLGVTRDEVRGSRRGDPQPDRPRVGRDGKVYKRSRPTKAEIERRVPMTARLYLEGYGRDAICEALDIAHGTMKEDLIKAGLGDLPPRSVKRGPAPTMVWRNEASQQSRRLPKPKPSPSKPQVVPEEPPRAAYLDSYVVEDLEMVEKRYELDNVENRLACDAEDAARAGDEQWFSRARVAIGMLMTRLETLQRVLNDPAERNHRKNTINELREDDGPRLRAV